MKDLASSAIFLCISIFVLVSSQSFSSKGNRFFSLAYNPALYPRIIALILFVVSIVLIVKAIRKGSLKNIQVRMDKQKAIKAGKLFLVVVLYLAGIYFVGYIVSSLICITLFVYLFDGTIKQGIFYSVGLTTLLYVIFRIGFKILLPAGIIFENWG